MDPIGPGWPWGRESGSSEQTSLYFSVCCSRWNNGAEWDHFSVSMLGTAWRMISFVLLYRTPPLWTWNGISWPSSLLTWGPIYRVAAVRYTHGHSFLAWRTFFSWVTLQNEARDVISVFTGVFDWMMAKCATHRGPVGASEAPHTLLPLRSLHRGSNKCNVQWPDAHRNTWWHILSASDININPQRSVGWKQGFASNIILRVCLCASACECVNF